MNIILIAKEKNLVIRDTCEYKPCSHLGQVAKKTNRKKLHVACTVTMVVAYHLRLHI